jgi:hypothetical protein
VTDILTFIGLGPAQFPSLVMKETQDIFFGRHKTSPEEVLGVS